VLRPRRVSRRRLLDARCSDEAGFTLVEMMVAMVISIILLTLMTTMITIYTKAQASTVNSANAASNVRLAFLSLEHDIQSANPVATLSSVSAYNDELQMTIQPSGTLVTWQYTYSTQQLTRQTGSATPLLVLSHVTNGNPSSGGLPVFKYLDHCSINLVTEPQSTPASISASTTAVQITLSVANVNSAPYGSVTGVHIMNQPPGTNRCG
jgi:prepilin-type N-terminal cleavage/methylation domain-containing protein